MNQIEFQILSGAQTILVDGLPISTEYDIGYAELVSSAIGGGDYFILTCSCGEPDCAAWKKPIGVQHSSERVTLHILEPGPKRTVDFARPAHVAAIRGAMGEVIGLNPTLPTGQKLGPYGSPQGNFEDFATESSMKQRTASSFPSTSQPPGRRYPAAVHAFVLGPRVRPSAPRIFSNGAKKSCAKHADRLACLLFA